MTLASELTKVQYNGDGSTTAFTVSFVFYENDGIKAILLSSAGVETIQTLDTNYTLSGGNGIVGTLTMTTAPASGETLTIKSDIDDTQETSLPLGGALASTAIELRLDILTRLVQQKEEDFSRTIKLNETTTFSAPTVADPVTGEFLRWKADGTIESAVISDTTGTASSVDITDTDTTKDKLVSNLLAKNWENIKDVITAVASTTPVNTLQVTSSDTGNPILLGATGTDDNIGITITPKGTGDTILSTGDLTLTSGSIALSGTVDGRDVATDGTKLDGISTGAEVNLSSYITLGTKQTTTSGTAFDFTGIPAGVKRVTILFQGVSLSGTENLLIQLGDSGGFETSGYIATGGIITGGGVSTIASSTAGFIIPVTFAGNTVSGAMTLNRMDSAHLWVAHYSGKVSTNDATAGGGHKTLSAELTQIRFTRTGSDTFDAGSVNIMYEV